MPDRLADELETHGRIEGADRKVSEQTISVEVMNAAPNAKK